MKVPTDRRGCDKLKRWYLRGNPDAEAVVRFAQGCDRLALFLESHPKEKRRRRPRKNIWH